MILYKFQTEIPFGASHRLPVMYRNYPAFPDLSFSFHHGPCFVFRRHHFPRHFAHYPLRFSWKSSRSHSTFTEKSRTNLPTGSNVIAQPTQRTGLRKTSYPGVFEWRWGVDEGYPMPLPRRSYYLQHYLTDKNSDVTTNVKNC